MTTKQKVNKKQEIKDVQPIRTLAQIEDMKWALKRHCSERDYIMFLLGINTGLRISDLLNLKIQDIKAKKRIVIREGKTKKPRTIYLPNIYDELNNYLDTLNNSSWVFPSRKGDNAISRIQAHRQLKKGADMADIPYGISTHTMRKTFGYFYYKQTKDIASLQTILSHSHPKVTLRYIGIVEEDIENSMNNFTL